MSAEIPVIPKTEVLHVHTGNVVNWNRMKRKLLQKPSEELAECVASTVESWLTGVDKKELQYATEIECYNKKFIEKLPVEDRKDFKITVKIFLQKLDPSLLQSAVEKVMSELGVSTVETVLLSVPETERSVDTILPLWAALEKLVEEEKVFSVGTSDLDKTQLEQLYNSVTVKPCVNQVNLDGCCVMPEELVAFAKENDIQLLTHSDPSDLLPEEKLQELLAKQLTARDGEHWQAAWVSRYSVLIKCQGVLKTKGYILNATRKL